jgi:hydrogenase expression/formation protein HypC
MCLTLPVRVISLEGDTAVVDAGGIRRTASTLAVPEVRVGDWAILAAGLLVRIVDPAAARQITAALRLATDREASPTPGGQP